MAETALLSTWFHLQPKTTAAAANRGPMGKHLCNTPSVPTIKETHMTVTHSPPYYGKPRKKIVVLLCNTPGLHFCPQSQVTLPEQCINLCIIETAYALHT